MDATGHQACSYARDTDRADPQPDRDAPVSQILSIANAFHRVVHVVAGVVAETPPQHREPALRSRGGSVAQRHPAID
jgi:hypothetical protein